MPQVENCCIRLINRASHLISREKGNYLSQSEHPIKDNTAHVSITEQNPEKTKNDELLLKKQQQQKQPSPHPQTPPSPPQQKQQQQNQQQLEQKQEQQQQQQTQQQNPPQQQLNDVAVKEPVLGKPKSLPKINNITSSKNSTFFVDNSKPQQKPPQQQSQQQQQQKSQQQQQQQQQQLPPPKQQSQPQQQPPPTLGHSKSLPKPTEIRSIKNSSLPDHNSQQKELQSLIDNNNKNSTETDGGQVIKCNEKDMEPRIG
jgi:hypothetical protein